MERWASKVRRLPQAVKRRVSGALEQNAHELAVVAARDAPKLTGRLSVNTGARKVDDDGLFWIAFSGVRDGYNKGYYAAWVEHGTEDTPAQPYFFTNYRVLRPRFRGRVTRAYRAGIKDGVSS